uniref:C-type lectin domain-containing protein n=1 Tax=Pelodiscus sinensis TaxID=13735 RepID=K7G833_PELSI
CPRWHRLALQLGAAGILVMAGAVLGMGIWGCRADSLISKERISYCYKLLTGHFLSTQGPGCKLCPPDWMLHRDKCYWLCKIKMSWHKSRDDCSRRGAQLPVIRDQVEMTFIQNTFQDTNEVWLGLIITPPSRNWTWTDGSLLNPALPKVKNPPEENNCGVIKANRINFEGCSGVSTCICEK